jgi:8-oxo-dGTP pyrophosphatase MutT (NUDIX family)
MKHEFSAGGIVYKREGEKIWVLVSQHSYHHGWVFPKGLIGDHVEGEKKEDTAIREVEEETGVIGKITKELPSTDYWYVFEGEKRKKTVYYYLMEFVSGDITKHDQEMENVEWLLVDDIETRLTYKADRRMWREARKLLTTNLI